ncbi:MAG TPA: diguanylate cyclase [Acetobacteraceae bacterium]|nr:diguanylate cyclase [Acetobacteraceae bacterium]
MDGTTGAAPGADAEALLEFLYLCPHGLAEFDADGVVGMMNPACLHLLLPLAGEDGSIPNLLDALAPFAPDLRLRLAAEAAPRGLLLDGLRIQVGHPPQARRWPPGPQAAEDPLVLSLTVLRLAPDRHMAVLSDVSAQVAQERRLREAEAWFAAVVQGADGYAFFSLDGEGCVADWNASGERLFGIEAAQAIGRHAAEVMATPEAAMPVPGRLALARREGWHLSEDWMPRAGDGRFWGSSVISVMRGEGPEPEAYLVVARDTTARRASAEELRRALCTDHLTGVLNRRHFFELAAEAVRSAGRSGQKLSAIMVDADHFKRVNDRFGHAAGDAVLTGIGGVLRGGVRAHLDIVGRLGGEEFCLLLPGLGLPEAVQVAERLRGAVEALRFEGREDLHATVSLGVAERGEATTPEALLSAADAALYAAKAGGRNRVGAAG